MIRWDNEVHNSASSGPLAVIWWSVCILKSQMSLFVSDSGLCILLWWLLSLLLLLLSLWTQVSQAISEHSNHRANVYLKKTGLLYAFLIRQVIRWQSKSCIISYGNYNFLSLVLRWSENAFQEIIRTGILVFVVLITGFSKLSLRCLSHQLILE